MSRRFRIGKKQPSNYLPLEDRRLLAGNITVFENVNLYIRGDQADNDFEIAVNDDQLEIVGLNGTTINHEESYLVTGAKVTGFGVSFEGGLRAHLGPGHDNLELRDVQFESMSLIYGGTGDDSIEILDSRFLDQTTIQTFDGNDSVSAHRSRFEDAFRAITLDGEDSVNLIATAINGNTIVAKGDHSDSIHAEDSHFMGEVNLLLPLDGDDTVQIDNPVVGSNQLGIFLGDGADTIHGDFTDANIAGTVRIGGQGGVDRGEMTMDDDMASKVTMATIEATGELVYDGLDGDIAWDFDSYTVGDTDEISLAAAQQIQFNQDTDVFSVAFTGSYDAPWVNEHANYVIQVFENESGEDPWGGEFDKPGNEVFFEVELSLDELNRVATGETYIEDEHSPAREIYEFSADVNMQFEGGETYWISIYQKAQINADDPLNYDEFNNWFYWHAGESESTNLVSNYWPESGWTVNYTQNGRYNSGMSFELRS